MKTVFKYIWQYFRKLDKLLFIAVAALSVFSLVLLYSIVVNGAATISVSSSLYKTQAAAVIAGTGNVSQKSSDEELKMAQDSIRRAVVSCYAIEGRYPDTYKYLAENYGLTVDEKKYTVHYEIFASNIMPEITVTPV